MTHKHNKSILRKSITWVFRAIGLVAGIFLIWSMFPINPTIPPIQPRPNTAYWQLKNGYNIAYTCIKGDTAGTKPVVIFLHGGPGGYIHTAIIRQMEIVAQAGYTVYLYDQIGSGLSDRLPRPKDYAFERHLDDLDDIISNQIGAKQVTLIGHSFGGILATHFAARHPEKISRLILSSPGDLQPLRTDMDGNMIDMATCYPKPPQYVFKTPIEVFKQTEKDFLQPRIVMSMACAMAFNIKWASDREFDDYTNTMASKFTQGMVANPKNVQPEEGGAGGYSHGFSNYYGNLSDIRDRLRQLDIPTLVLQGQYDQGEYAYVYEYADLLKGQYVFIENAGHIIWWDQPEQYTQHLLEFVQDTAHHK